MSKTRLALAALLAWTDSAAGERLLLVVNRADAQLSLFTAQGTGLTLASRLPVGKTPREVCISPDGKRAYVSAQEGHSVTVVDLDARKVVATIAPAELLSPDGCVVSPDSKKLYVVAMGRDSVFVVSTSEHKVLKEIKLPLKVPRRIVYTPDQKRLFVGCNQTPEIAVIDGATHTVVRSFKVGNEARGGLAFTPDGKTFLVGNVEDDTVSWVDMDSFTVKKVMGTPISPQRIEVGKDGEFAYVLTRMGTRDAGADARALLFAMPLKQKHDASRTVPLGKAPWGLAMNAEGTLLYASNNGDDNVLVIDAATLKVVNDVKVGKDPNGLAFRP
jgi:YVTN family beta-propeller protein